MLTGRVQIEETPPRHIEIGQPFLYHGQKLRYRKLSEFEGENNQNKKRKPMNWPDIYNQLDDLKSDLSEINDKIENLQAFKNKMLGIGITTGIAIGLGFGVIVRYLS